MENKFNALKRIMQNTQKDKYLDNVSEKSSTQEYEYFDNNEKSSTQEKGYLSSIRNPSQYTHKDELLHEIRNTLEYFIVFSLENKTYEDIRKIINA